MSRMFAPLLVIAGTCLSASAHAAEPYPWKLWEIVGEGGYRFGGKMSLDDEEGSVDGNVRTRSAATFGGKVGFRMEPDGFIFLWYSREDSTLEIDPDDSTLAGPVRDLSIEYFHFGGYVQGAHEGTLPYLGISLGATRFASPSIDDEWSPSFALDVGLKVPLGDWFQLRAGGRLPVTFNTGTTEIFCVSPAGCGAKLEGKPYVQAELYGGIGVNF